VEQRGISLHRVGKRFGDKQVLSDINIDFRQGTIHSIVGENGAGKSTLMNILSGVLSPTEGTVMLDGKPCRFTGPDDSIQAGIGMVYQHFMLIPTLSVWKNVILGAETVKLGWIQEKRAKEQIRNIQQLYGISLNLDDQVGNLTVGEQQRVEILKVLYKGANTIIFDEPTAVLTPQETDNLLQTMLELKAAGKTIVFISHKMEEVLRVSDEITVIRHGRKVKTVKAASANRNELISMMVGKEVHFPKNDAAEEKVGDVVLKADRLATKRSGFGCPLQQVSFTIRQGEILGIAGIDGNGQLELIRALLGLDRLVGGTIEFEGRRIDMLPTSRIRELGIGCVPPDRHHQALLLDAPLLNNFMLGSEHLAKFRKGFFLDHQKIRHVARQFVEQFDVRNADLNRPIRNLSGGNQQKVILARECELRDIKLLIAAYPTRGLDTGAMDFLYRKLIAYKEAGKAILFISADLDEVMRLSDRIAVMNNGRLTPAKKQMTREEIGAYMANAGENMKGETG
jgi:simple sugar transport system ATP-binding protein